MASRHPAGECAKCLEYLYDDRNQHLLGACASVGISYGLSTGQVLRNYIDQYHRNKHKINIR